jgi:hypothetical protein
MGKNKTGKYLKYAIGEIILVVIGILIALSINNWNEDRIKQNIIKESLTQILNDLKQDKDVLEFFNKTEAEHISYLKNVSSGNYKLVGLDTILRSLDHYMFFSKNNNGYSGLKNSGNISIINNLELKSAMTDYYERVHENLAAASHFSEKFTNDRVIPYSIANLKPNMDFLTPNEVVIDKLETSSLRYLVNYQIVVKGYILGQVKTGLKNNSNLTLLIQSELKK